MKLLSLPQFSTIYVCWDCKIKLFFSPNNNLLWQVLFRKQLKNNLFIYYKNECDKIINFNKSSKKRKEKTKSIIFI